MCVTCTNTYPTTNMKRANTYQAHVCDCMCVLCRCGYGSVCAQVGLDACKYKYRINGSIDPMSDIDMIMKLTAVENL